MKSHPASPTGIGLRQPHYARVLEERPHIGFVEVHSENFFHDGGAALRTLERARGCYPVSLHGVGLALASVDARSEAHVERLAKLVERVEPEFVSEHLCWGAVDGVHFNDLLPFPYTGEALALVAARVNALQDRLRRPVLIENLSAYVQFRDAQMSEAQFLADLVCLTGCGLLLDLNNLYVNARNFGSDPMDALEQLPMHAVREIHLAGHAVTEYGLIDTHGSAVCDDVWSLLAAVRRRGVCAPALIEWDTDLPELDVLLAEAARADRIGAVADESNGDRHVCAA
ncbi:DUF692 domain-containing protein [Methyloversatilis sp.]|uniref:MNIO family bufferin maturase n=1 Tax=Methyloversatilis sp. TaxID=2569862 RepID=UPI0027350112|nr:DUF692 domain-containing protein [Methyloversatilis sp.]MDP2870439.1 DUF692 domain-containing protein [Methyloversatilis sp.]MDP3457242.1 DUF692 domain-containing protein [Methyloversatilis sp.]MDP3576634.1 DUF692 domain-containing protein [Methyloversatilis sp.]